MVGEAVTDTDWVVGDGARGGRTGRGGDKAGDRPSGRDDKCPLLCAVKAQEAASVCYCALLALSVSISGGAEKSQERGAGAGAGAGTRAATPRGTRDVAFRFLVGAGAEEADDVGRSINHLTTVVVLC